MGKIFIIAEVGLNHNGDFETAKDLIQAASDAGVDACKFQVYWSIVNMKKYNFTKRQWTALFTFCEKFGVEWFCTPFDIEAVRWLDKMGMKRWKIPSNKIVIDNEYILKEVVRAKNREYTVISTGISNDVKIKELIRLFGNKPYTLLHCVSKYPTLYKDLNLNRIAYLRAMFKCPIGFSDHSVSIIAPLEAAMQFGASMIEKHITLDRKMPGPDHCASLIPKEFEKMVTFIRKYEKHI